MLGRELYEEHSHLLPKLYANPKTKVTMPIIVNVSYL
jgi:hypothetical protein